MFLPASKFWRSALLLLTAAAASAAAAVPAPDATADETVLDGAPRYAVVPCCQLCPQARNPDAYAASSYLQEFQVLQEGLDGWLFRTRVDLTTRIEISDASLDELRRLATAMRARGSELVVVLQPPRALMDVDKLSPDLRRGYDFEAARRGYTQALARIRSAGVTVPPLEQLVKENKGYEYFFRRDHHWTPAGAEATAKLVADTVQKMPSFQGIPRQNYVTHASALIGKPGTLQKVATQICGAPYAMQYVTGYATEAADAAGGDLLGDAAGQSKKSDASGGLLDTGNASGGLLDDSDGGAPQIALVGTSNSDAKGGYNFGGYLQQHLGADVLNAALSGGSFDGALLHYLPSEAYQKHPPRIVVWEMPWQNWPGADKNPYRTFRQALPLVHDGCRERPIALEQKLQLKAGSNELLFNAGGKPLQGGNYWLDLQFDDPTVKDLHATVWYYTGQKESLKLHFNQYVDNGGRFVTELRSNRADYAAATFMGATIEMVQPPAKPLNVTARLCAADPSRPAPKAKARVAVGEGAAHAPH